MILNLSSTPAFPIMVHVKLSITICVQHVKGYSILDRQTAQTKLQNVKSVGQRGGYHQRTSCSCMCLTRLRLGLLERDLANRFNLSKSQVSRIWITWLDFLYTRVRSIPIWPSQTYIRETMPSNFKESYPNTRMIIDCTEVFIEMSSQSRSQSATLRIKTITLVKV